MVKPSECALHTKHTTYQSHTPCNKVYIIHLQLHAHTRRQQTLSNTKADQRVVALSNADGTRWKALVLHHGAEKAEDRTLRAESPLAGGVCVHMCDASRPERLFPCIVRGSWLKCAFCTAHAESKELAGAVCLQLAERRR